MCRCSSTTLCPGSSTKRASYILYYISFLKVVINTEWGALGNTGSLDFVRTSFDMAVDKNSKNPGKQAID